MFSSIFLLRCSLTHRDLILLLTRTKDHSSKTIVLSHIKTVACTHRLLLPHTQRLLLSQKRRFETRDYCSLTHKHSCNPTQKDNRMLFTTTHDYVSLTHEDCRPLTHIYYCNLTHKDYGMLLTKTQDSCSLSKNTTIISKKLSSNVSSVCK